MEVRIYEVLELLSIIGEFLLVGSVCVRVCVWSLSERSYFGEPLSVFYKRRAAFLDGMNIC
jgi:hypothetical protein